MSIAVGDKATAAWANAIINTSLGENGVSTTTTLAGTGTNVAHTAAVTFTLTATRRVRIDVNCQFQMATGTLGTYFLQPAYNSGSSPSIGSATLIGMIGIAGIASPVLRQSVMSSGTALLPAGTYTAYCAVQRNSGGGATDTARFNQVNVYMVGDS